MAAGGQRKKASTKKTAKPPAKRSGGGVRPWLVLGAALLFIGAYLYFVQGDAPGRADEPKIPNYTLEKSGAGASLNFTDKSQQIHRVVDQVLTDQLATVLDTKQETRSVKRTGAEGDIHWDVRRMPIAVDSKRRDALQNELKKYLDKIGAVILETAYDQYNGETVLRMDIGIRDTLEGDPLTIVTDKLYVIEKQTQLPPKQPKEQAISNGKAKLALIIDDFGYSEAPIRAYAKIRRPLTFAVLPHHPFSVEAANAGAVDGRQIILHLPMEAQGAAKPAGITVNTDMSDSEIRAVVSELTNVVPHLVGVNNHQGSKATADLRVMKAVMRELAGKGLFFVDSKTSGGSLAYREARAQGVSTAENELFIDNDNDIAAIKTRLREAANLALKNGSAVAIGHARVNTAAAIEQSVAELEKEGIEFVFVSKLLK